MIPKSEIPGAREISESEIIAAISCALKAKEVGLDWGEIFKRMLQISDSREVFDAIFGVYGALSEETRAALAELFLQK